MVRIPSRILRKSTMTHMTKVSLARSKGIREVINPTESKRSSKGYHTDYLLFQSGPLNCK